MDSVLSMDNILGADEIENLFTDNEETQETPPEPTENNNQEKEETTETVNVDTLFTEESESVGSEEKNIEEKEGTISNKESTSPKTDFYSSITNALVEDGIFPDLEKETINNVKTAEDFAEVIEKQIQSRFDERQKRIDDALNADIEPSEIRKYESTLSYLESIKDEAIIDESNNGEKLRQQLIYQDFINRGYSKERAQREVKKSFDAGSDIEDAKEALTSNKEFFQNEYNNLIKEAQAERDEEVKERKAQAEKLKKSILEDSKVFGELQIDKATRQKVFDTISKPIYKNPETGELYTALQKYEMENRVDFLKNMGLFYTLTDGFKNLDGLVKGKVRKEMKKGLRDLESTLNNTARTPDGNLKFVTGVSEDGEAFLSDYKLDI